MLGADSEVVGGNSVLYDRKSKRAGALIATNKTSTQKVVTLFEIAKKISKAL